VARVAVLAGGPSSEHEISLLTSACLLGLLRSRGHEARPVLIDHEGGWHRGGLEDAVEDAAAAPAQDADEALAALREAGETAYVGLHGPYGEDGTVQRLLERAGVAYTGAGPQASALCMDKELSKLAAHQVGLRTAGHHVVGGRNAPLLRITRTVGYPCFVKPLACGSSVGAGRVDDEEQLPAAVAAAQAADPGGKALVEEFLPGLELTAAVLRMDGKLRAMPLVAIRPGERFYDYHAKYESEDTVLECPAQVPDDLTERIQRQALGLYGALELRGVARLDLILPEGGGEPVFLEVNTLPGFTDHSLVPLACRTAGVDPALVVDAVLADANVPA
jgi:D-alanine--D-alanine ligase